MGIALGGYGGCFQPGVGIMQEFVGPSRGRDAVDVVWCPAKQLVQTEKIQDKQCGKYDC